MNLLPFNAPQKDQDFMKMMDEQMKIDLSDFSLDPLHCHFSILEHIALIKGADITDMQEDEIRELLSIYTGEHIGTIGAVDDASMTYFKNTTIREWFERSELLTGQFDAVVYVDDSVLYDREIFEKTTHKINTAKNVRSEFVGYEMQLPQKNINTVISSASVFKLKLSGLNLFNEKPNLNVGGNVIWKI